ncbi:hypothetical protein PIROE2DRAFT_1887, partial [Piromyces sp. E2]
KYVPTVFENFVTDIIVDDKKVELELWDTAGQEDYDRLRSLSYPDSHVILICFAISEPETLFNVRDKWIIGCKKDLSSDPDVIHNLRLRNETPVTFEEGMEMTRELGAYRYIECSSKTGEGVYDVFDNATRASLTVRKSSKIRKRTVTVKGKRKRKNSCILL